MSTVEDEVVDDEAGCGSFYETNLTPSSNKGLRHLGPEFWAGPDKETRLDRPPASTRPRGD